jgi:hypothetical protein
MNATLWQGHGRLGLAPAANRARPYTASKLRRCQGSGGGSRPTAASETAA